MRRCKNPKSVAQPGDLIYFRPVTTGRLHEDRCWLRSLAPSPLQGEGWDGGRMVDRQRASFIDRTTPTLTLPLQGGGNSTRQHQCACGSSCNRPASDRCCNVKFMT